MKNYFPAEWHEQDAIMIAWPHEATDWSSLLPEVTKFYVELSEAISRYQRLLVLCHDENVVKSRLAACQFSRITFVEIDFNDTWARDFGPISVNAGGRITLLDYQFNGWGGKFESSADNQTTKQLFDRSVFNSSVQYDSQLDFILEGGSIESNGEGILLTTSKCLLSETRNPALSQDQIESRLKRDLFVEKVIWLGSGQLEGDDTDGHIDTLARFCDSNTIAYVKCEDERDSHFESLLQMEKELLECRNLKKEPFELVALPMVEPIFCGQGQRLAATYANFLIMNDAILVPTYGVKTDDEACRILADIFTSHEIVPINSRILVEWGGSLHCSTMQLFKGSLA